METAEKAERSTRSGWFKSYYVVWKPQVGCEVMSSRRGLNRTMQYGNCFLFQLMKGERTV